MMERKIWLPSILLQIRSLRWESMYLMQGKERTNGTVIKWAELLESKMIDITL
ncbi:hypothetical protein [Bacillus sp. AFS017274]|uniref:hypothetical protein n=1 Tax=Bacillaceae TaxID=186817 RepID=UPI0015CF55EA|nr:hypothetical protein [Bacillus sp. AFS017274]